MCITYEKMRRFNYNLTMTYHKSCNPDRIDGVIEELIGTLYEIVHKSSQW